MKYISVYDIEAERLEELSIKYDISEETIIEMLLDSIDEQDEKELFGKM